MPTYLLTVLLSLCLVSPVWAAPVQTSDIGYGDAAAFADVAFPGNVTSGNLLTLCVSRYTQSVTDAIVAGDVTKQAGTATIGAVTIDISENNALDTSNRVSTAIARMSVTGSGPLTLRVSGNSGDYYAIVVSEWADLTATPEDEQNGNGSGTAASSTNVTSAGKAILLGCLGHNHSTTTITPDGAWTQLAENEDGDTHQTISFIYRAVETGTTDAAEWTIGTTVEWAAGAVVYTDNSSGGGGGDPVIPRSLMLIGVGQ